MVISPSSHQHDGSARPPIELFHSTLEYARNRQYAGYDYADGLSCPFRSLLPFENRWSNILFQESAKRAPVNIRPLMLIPRRRSFMGSALFALAEHRFATLTGEQEAERRSARLLEWLWENRREEPFGWGHNHDIQKLDEFIPRNTPNIITATFVARAVLEIAPEDGPPIMQAIEAELPNFIQEELVVTTSDGPRLRYRPDTSTDSFVLNVNALGGTLLVELGQQTDRPELRELGESILAYVASRQTSLGGWTYADPPSASHLSMDNHHNGFVLDALLRYRELTGSDRFDETIETGLEFYRSVHFDEDGAPNWDESSTYPRDIHAAAQGVITFTASGDLAFARRILEWTREHLYDGAGRFYYRKGPYLTRRFTLMRWCQAWMAVALSRYCHAVSATD